MIKLKLAHLAVLALLLVAASAGSLSWVFETLGCAW